MTRDPFRGMDVDGKAARHARMYRRQTCYFCAPGCKRRFDANPEQYVKKAE